MTKNDCIEMARKYLTGQSFKDIAKDAGMDHRTIAKRIRKVGMEALDLYEAVHKVK